MCLHLLLFKNVEVDIVMHMMQARATCVSLKVLAGPKPPSKKKEVHKAIFSE